MSFGVIAMNKQLLKALRDFIVNFDIKSVGWDVEPRDRCNSQESYSVYYDLVDSFEEYEKELDYFYIIEVWNSISFSHYVYLDSLESVYEYLEPYLTKSDCVVIKDFEEFKTNWINNKIYQIFDNDTGIHYRFVTRKQSFWRKKDEQRTTK